jgi:hypothetical protein
MQYKLCAHFIFFFFCFVSQFTEVLLSATHLRHLWGPLLCITIQDCQIRENNQTLDVAFYWPSTKIIQDWHSLPRYLVFSAWPQTIATTLNKSNQQCHQKGNFSSINQINAITKITL